MPSILIFCSINHKLQCNLPHFKIGFISSIYLLEDAKKPLSITRFVQHNKTVKMISESRKSVSSARLDGSDTMLDMWNL